LARATRRPQPGPIRLAHWLNLIFLLIMAGSGLEIFAAFPALGPKGALYSWYPWAGVLPPEALRLGDWLAGARHWHFAFGWLLVANGLFYLAYLLASGEARRRLFYPPRDLRGALQTLAAYLRLRRPPPQGFYNGLQRLAYTGVLFLAAVEILSGLAIYKPVQLRGLGLLFGGYDGARAVHFLGLVGLGLFTAGHVLMVAAHPRSFPPMITGGKPAPREEGGGDERAP
jgi:thiosulfate reductase cytochrome b subunit